VTEPTPVVLEVAVNGVTTPEWNPAVPREPAAIAEEALRCIEAGAAIVHTHSHDPMRPAEATAALYLEAYRPVLAERPDAILYPTIGIGDTIEERYGHYERLAAEGVIRQGLLDPGSVNLGSVPPDASAPGFDYVYANPLSHVHHEVEACRRLRLGPSIAIFEPGFLRVILAYHRAGRLPAGALVKFYFSRGGYLQAGEPSFGAPPIPEALDLYLAMVDGTGLPWAVAVLGGPVLETPIAELAIERGGHLRVGLEDHVGAASNLAEVERARRLCEKHGRRLATVPEATALLGLPRESGESARPRP
jgi:3-keto-5-aminohexanoate cleavage enzyme